MDNVNEAELASIIENDTPSAAKDSAGILKNQPPATDSASSTRRRRRDCSIAARPKVRHCSHGHTIRNQNMNRFFRILFALLVILVFTLVYWLFTHPILAFLVFVVCFLVCWFVEENNVINYTEIFRSYSKIIFLSKNNFWFQNLCSQLQIVIQLKWIYSINYWSIFWIFK